MVFEIIEQVVVLKMVAMQSLIKVFNDPVSTAPTHVLLAEQNFQMVPKLHFWAFKLQKCTVLEIAGQVDVLNDNFLVFAAVFENDHFGVRSF